MFSAKSGTSNTGAKGIKLIKLAKKIRILSYINIAIEVYFVMVDLVGILLVFSLPNIVR